MKLCRRHRIQQVKWKIVKILIGIFWCKLNMWTDAYTTGMMEPGIRLRKMFTVRWKWNCIQKSFIIFLSHKVNSRLMMGGASPRLTWRLGGERKSHNINIEWQLLSNLQPSTTFKGQSLRAFQIILFQISWV